MAKQMDNSKMERAAKILRDARRVFVKRSGRTDDASVPDGFVAGAFGEQVPARLVVQMARVAINNGQPFEFVGPNKASSKCLSVSVAGLMEIMVSASR